MVYQYQPVNPLNAFAQSFQLVRGIQDDNARRQQEQVAQQQAMKRQRDLQGAIANLRMNPSPEAIAEFGLQFPEAKEQIEGYFKTIGEAKQSTQKQAMSEVIIAQRTGRLDQIPVILERFAVAAENARDPAMAQEFRDAAEFAKQNPEAAAETAKLRFGMVAPDEYKLIFDNSLYDTAKIKEVLAEGLEYGTPEFQARMKELNDEDPIVNVSGVGAFSREAIMEAIRSGQGSVTPLVPEEAVRALIQNPSRRDEFDRKYGKGASDRYLGGGGSNATGNFRGD